MAAMQDKPPLGFQLLQAADVHEIRLGVGLSKLISGASQSIRLNRPDTAAPASQCQARKKVMSVKLV